MLTAPTREARALSPLDRQRILVEWNATDVPFPLERCVHQLLEEQVVRSPDAVALTFRDQRITYRELNRRANQLAHRLRALGIGPEVRVGVLVERSPEAIIARLGTLKAGGAYVPLNPALPGDRLAFMLYDAGVRVLLRQSRLRERSASFTRPVIELDHEKWTESGSDTNPVSGVTSGNLAYVMYTSGSTGRPKGVLIDHRGLTNIVCAQIRTWGIEPTDRVVQYLNLSFDASQAEIFRTLVRGATLCLPPPDMLPGRALLHYIRDSGVTFFTSVPSTLAALPMDEPVRALHTLTLGGEAFPAELAAHWRQGRRVFNGYGPTETTIGATLATDWDLSKPPPLGRPISNKRVYVLDEHLEPLPVGESGELYIGGEGVARGYVSQPDATAEKFLPDPYYGRPGARMYRSGDLVRWLPDGNLDFLGRVDDQVKIRGYRIELSEIEAVLGQHPNVRNAVVLAREDTPGNKRLVGYVSPQNTPEPTARELRRFLAEHLPDYMVPAAFVLMSEIPLTPNGKADRKALPAPQPTRPELDTEFVAPRDAEEDAIATIWSQVLRVDEVGVHDNFFELGGNSLLATQAVARLRETLRLEVPLRTLFDEPTVAGLSTRIADLRSADDALSAPPMEHADRTADLPLSFAQRRLWFVDQMEPGNPLYNLPAAMRLRGPLNHAVLERCLQEIVRRHEVLRTTFATSDGQAVQVILPSIETPLPVHDLSGLLPGEREYRAMEFARAEALKPFDLARGPLLRPSLVRLANDDHFLLPTMHHAVCDAWSLALITKELAALYEAFIAGRPSPLPELRWQYADFAVWQRKWLDEDVLENELAYWREQLAHLPHALELPTDKPRPTVQRFRGDQHGFTLPRSLLESLEKVSRSEGVTLYMLLLAAYQVLLSRYSGQPDLAVGSPVAGRNRAETEAIIGFFVNILVLRADLSADLSFRKFLAQVKETCLGAFAHQDVPFEKLVDDLKPERDLSRSPLFQAAFILQNAPPPTLTLGDVTISQIDIDQGTAKSDVSLSMTVTEQGLSGRLVYNTDLFEPETIDRFARHFRTLLEGIVADPDRKVSELPLLTPAEKTQLLVEWNATAFDYPHDRCVHHLIESQTERMPDAVALVYQGASLTYRELNHRANHLARRLRELGVGPETTVALCAERSPEAIVGMLGVLKAGGAYVPMAPSLPAERLEFMLADSKARVILSRSDIHDQLPPHLARVIDLDSYALGSTFEFSAEDDPNPRSVVGPNNLAYIIYTSGSTGRPKGVMVPHGGLTNVILQHVRSLEIEPGDRYPQFMYLHFDAAQAEVYRALVGGATLVQAPSDLLMSSLATWELLVRERITMVGFPPSVLSAVDGEYMKGVRTLIIAGEACPAELAAKWLPGRKVWNAYGPTETTICATMATDWDSQRQPPIGRPVANTQVYVLDQRLQPTPIGVCGELYIGGDGVTRGYLNLPELTAAHFIPDPFSGKPGARLYKSGDLVRWTSDGNLEFIGRVDNQVKIRGFRIELGEIEAALRAHSALKENVVMAREDVPGTKQLVAYVVAEHERTPTAAELRDFLAGRLPEYMVPAVYVFMPALPRLHMGKINRKALPAPDRNQPCSDRPHVAPRSKTEESLTEIWSAVLRREQIGIHENFFTLGGDSISSIQVIARANRAGLRLTPADLFQHQTIAELAAFADAAPQQAESEPLDVLQEELAYWVGALSKEIAPIPVDFAGARAGKPAMISVQLDADETHGLLNETAHVYRTQTAEVLLTAFVQAWGTWTGRRSLLVDLNIPTSDDATHLSVAFPTIIDMSDDSGPGEALVAVKDQLRAVPKDGRGFAALRCCRDETIVRPLSELPSAEVSFHYRGAEVESPDAKSHLIRVRCSVSDGRLHVDWMYHPNVHRKSTIENLAAAFLERLRELIAHCRSAEGGRFTVSDFPEARMSHDELAELLSQISQTGENDGR